MISLLRRWRIRRLLSLPVPEERRQWLAEHVTSYEHQSADRRRRLEQIVTVMIAQRHWEGCEGLVVTEQMKTVIAGNAAVMLLGAEDHYYFDTVTAILVFPGTIRRHHEGHQSPTVGEAWANGGVVLSWPEVRSIGRTGCGRNVVIHEFAHHLDGLDGEMGGSIPFNNLDDQQQWETIAFDEYEKLVEDVSHNRQTVLDPYGATNEAEFFAVCSECFFERPIRMIRAHAELYGLLKRFYQIDPLEWADPKLRSTGESGHARTGG
jgi:Mlc titration factor MtfA (ptsG expression regulator)